MAAMAKINFSLHCMLGTHCEIFAT